MKNVRINKKSILKIPLQPGVYIFKDINKKPIYVGMSKALKNRVKSYFGGNLETKTKAMISEAKFLSYIVVSSEFEALLLEAKLVSKYQPPYNIELKDDKSPLYVVITREQFPRVMTLRQTQLNKIAKRSTYGPFINSRSVKKILKQIRRIFPYATHKPGKRACLYSQIGLCKPCPSIIKNKEQKRQYLKNIKQIENTLSGQLKTVKRDLEKQMYKASAKQDFEKAAEILNKLNTLEQITTSRPKVHQYLKDPNLISDIRAKETSELKNLLKPEIDIKNLERIECFDVSHFAGSFPTSSMVTFLNGEPDKKFYRHFKLKKGAGDTGAIAETLQRRSRYLEKWGKPDLIIVDGGKGQVNAALEAIDEIPVIGLAKRFETLIIKSRDGFVSKPATGKALNLVQRLRDESHRFARRYHHHLVKKAIRET